MKRYGARSTRASAYSAKRSEAAPGFRAALLLNPIVVPIAAASIVHGPCARVALAIAALGVVAELAYSAWVDFQFLKPAGVRLGLDVFLRPFANIAHFAVSIVPLAYPVVHWR